VRARQFLLGVLLAVMCLEGCAPVLVGGLIWKSRKSKEEKRIFLQELNRINLEREKAGLDPLDKCIELYHFDPGWARTSADCKTKIDSLIAAGIQPDLTKVHHK